MPIKYHTILLLSFGGRNEMPRSLFLPAVLPFSIVQSIIFVFLAMMNKSFTSLYEMCSTFLEYKKEHKCVHSYTFG